MAQDPALSPKRRLLVAERSCGPCTACCTLVGVEELGKTPWTPCRHEKDPFIEDGPGCRCYDGRPAGCRTFLCIWRLGALVDEDDRPDRLGVMIDAYRMEDGSPGIVFWETRPGGFMSAFPRLRPYVLESMKRDPPRPAIVRWYGGKAIDQWDGVELKAPEFKIVEGI